jgi:hypothetical protein
MSGTDDWSPDEPLDTETYESWDEALDRQDEVEPDRPGDPEGERELDTELFVDQAEIDEVGASLDDPEQLAVLDGGIDDPDGVGLLDSGSANEPTADTDAGWDLDAGDRRTAAELDAEAADEAAGDGADDVEG